MSFINNLNIKCNSNIEDLLNKNLVAVIGSRKPTKESKKFIKNVIPEFKDSVIVSGLAFGCDIIAHQTAIKNDIPTIAVLPCGIDNIYPRKHRFIADKIVKKGGALISEYESNDKASNNKFIERDSLMAKLSNKVVVVQCAKHSGTMHTVNFAIEYNKKLLVNDNPAPGNQYIIEKYPCKVL